MTRGEWRCRRLYIEQRKGTEATGKESVIIKSGYIQSPFHQSLYNLMRILPSRLHRPAFVRILLLFSSLLFIHRWLKETVRAVLRGL